MNARERAHQGLNRALLKLAETGDFAGAVSDIEQEITIAMDLVAKATFEECAKIADECDKSTHPADVADKIRARSTA